MKKINFFIFARSGSKGIKNKNIVLLNKKPLIAWSIIEAKKSRFVNDIYVSTDSKQIAKISKKYGAKIIERPKKLATDNSKEILSWKHAISKFKILGDDEIFVSIPATSPFRSVVDIDKAIQKFMRKKHDIIYGISESSKNPYLNMVKILPNGRIKVSIQNSKYFRRQDVPKIYDVTTVIYVSNFKFIKNCKSLSNCNIGYVLIPKSRALDIDDKNDLRIARALIR